MLPRTGRSFGPIGSPVPYSASSLSARCQGAAAFLDTRRQCVPVRRRRERSLSIHQQQLEQGLEIGRRLQRAVDRQWRFEYFNGVVLATDFIDPIQAFTFGASTAFSDLGGSPPKARYMAAVRGFLALANTNDPVSGNAPQRVWWSGANNPANWPTPGTSRRRAGAGRAITT
ncbi:MAG: hypothetical protein WDO24_23340 [Pseudomonadota bacterium]